MKQLQKKTPNYEIILLSLLILAGCSAGEKDASSESSGKSSAPIVTNQQSPMGTLPAANQSASFNGNAFFDSIQQASAQRQAESQAFQEKQNQKREDFQREMAKMAREDNLKDSLTNFTTIALMFRGTQLFASDDEDCAQERFDKDINAILKHSK